MIFENTLQLGKGIYTIPDLAKILRQPDDKIRRWLKTYWNGQLAEHYGDNYSWEVDGHQAVSFHTLVEFHLMILLGDAGVPPQHVMEAHRQLSKWYDTAFPFALHTTLDGLRVEGNLIYFELPDGGILSLNGSDQFNLDFIRLFFKKLNFGADDLASSLWPLGKEKSIVIDPERKLGHPTVAGHSVYPETLYSHHLAGDPISYIAYVYELKESEVSDAIEYCIAA